MCNYTIRTTITMGKPKTGKSGGKEKTKNEITNLLFGLQTKPAQMLC